MKPDDQVLDTLRAWRESGNSDGHSPQKIGRHVGLGARTTARALRRLERQHVVMHVDRDDGRDWPRLYRATTVRDRRQMGLVA